MASAVEPRRHPARSGSVLSIGVFCLTSAWSAATSASNGALVQPVWAISAAEPLPCFRWMPVSGQHSSTGACRVFLRVRSISCGITPEAEAAARETCRGRSRKSPPRSEAKKEVWIAGHEIPVAPSLQVEPAPIGRQKPSQRGLAALPRANDGNAGKRREILGKKRLTGSLHALQNET